MSKEWIIILVFSLITTLSWVGFEVHRVLSTSTLPEVLQEQLEPIDPHFSQEALEIIRSASSP